MTNTRYALAVLAAAAAWSLAASANAQTTQSVNGAINIYTPALVVNKTSDLSFGTVSRPTAGNGTVSLDVNSGNVTVTGGISIISGNPATRAAFTVTGTPQTNVNITYPQTFNLTRSGGSETLQVALTSSVGSGQLNSSGTLSVNMGGQLVVAASTVAGAYTGTYTVTAVYN